MRQAIADEIPATTIPGLPRPILCERNLGLRSFLARQVEARIREQREVALAVHVSETRTASLGVPTDRIARLDATGSQGWTRFPPAQMSGFDRRPKPKLAGIGKPS